MVSKRFYVIIVALVSILGLSACGGGWLGDRDEDKPPLPGERISILQLQTQLKPDEEALNGQSITLPDLWQNEFWPQAGGYPNHSMQNLALSAEPLQKIWTADIGAGSSSSLPLTAQPVIAGGRAFTLDADASLKAFDVQNGNRLWRTSVRKETEDDEAITGGISLAGGVLYVTSGYDELLAVNPDDGSIYWRTDLNAPSRAAPTILDGRVYVATLNSSVLAIDAKDGSLIWEYTGIRGSAGLLGASASAARQDIVVTGFSSGELTALRTQNGAVAWSDSLANVLRLGGISDLSDIKGLPVIDKDLVIAVSYGGKMAALNAVTGARVWTRELGGAETPWVAGNYIFLITGNNEIIAMRRETGAVLWVSQLAQYQDAQAKQDPITWSGPVLGGGRLLAFSSDGRAAEVNPVDGSLIRDWRTGEHIRISPAIADGTLYLLSENGTLIAYR